MEFMLNISSVLKQMSMFWYHTAANFTLSEEMKWQMAHFNMKCDSPVAFGGIRFSAAI